ncbi:MAG: hypothetical protein LBR56_06535 [Sporomusaceae bacterium]|nr:hypothetical protein [Sporomusaceae bacterium]
MGEENYFLAAVTAQKVFFPQNFFNRPLAKLRRGGLRSKCAGGLICSLDERRS